jgi:hypothetical protein
MRPLTPADIYWEPSCSIPGCMGTMCIDTVGITTHIATPAGTTEAPSFVIVTTTGPITGTGTGTITATGTGTPDGIIAIGTAATALGGGVTVTERSQPSGDTGCQKKLATVIQG